MVQAGDGRIVIMDSGSAMTKAGFAGDESPQITFPTIIGRPRDPTNLPEG